MHPLVLNIRQDYVIVKAQKMLSSHDGLLTIAMYQLINNLINVTNYDVRKKRAHNPQTVRAKQIQSGAKNKHHALTN